MRVYVYGHEVSRHHWGARAMVWAVKGFVGNRVDRLSPEIWAVYGLPCGERRRLCWPSAGTPALRGAGDSKRGAV